ncbi:hypothetical protein T439DRAFT_325048 [Meredithblackwellia eburnea MCA 4105]
MASPLQLWLSSRPPRTTYDANEPLYTAGGACKTWFTVEDGIHYVYADHDVSKKGCQGGPDAASTPPLHIHLGQDEYFKVITGKFVATMGGKPITLTSADGEYKAVKGQAHRFWSDEREGNMLVRMRVSPEDKKGFDEAFYRNCWGYLNDCDKHKVAPSLFQLVLMLYDWDMVLALPLPLPINKALHYIFAYWIGEKLLGYKASYPEYWPEKKDL